MNILFHIIINWLFGISLKLDYLGFLIIILGGFIIDIDHIIYQYFIVKNKSLKHMWRWHVKENKIKSLHHFPFHFLELGIIISLVFYFINWYLFLFFMGFSIHIAIDLIEHILFHKNLSPLRYYTLIGYIISKLSE